MNYEFKLIIYNQDGSEFVKIGDILDESTSKQEKGVLTNVEVHMDTVDENAKQRANAILARVKIIGKLDKNLAGRAAQLFEWSKSYDKDTWYKKVEIELRESSTDIIPIRTYIIPDMFVVDYKEIYSTTDENSHFELYLTQRDGNLDSIKSFD